jgi:dTDP-4-amino-4,6-dideoxygalactose transaminase
MTLPSLAASSVTVPFFRPSITEAEISAVGETLRSGWITSGPKVNRFEAEFAAALHAKNAVALNSCTAALHLAVEALELKAGQAVLIPTMTFAATAEIVRYLGAVPILVDCDPETQNMDLNDAAEKLEALRSGKLPHAINPDATVAGVVPVHVGGLMMDMDAVRSFATRFGLWVVEDAAHAFPAAWRRNQDEPWQRCGQETSAVTCFSFYANKTITTGEGGMAVTARDDLAARIRRMSLHGLSNDAWGRYAKGSTTWDYKILDPGYKYNLTDIAAAIGVHQLARAEEMRLKREVLACRYREAFANLEQIELPANPVNRIHSWHLFPVRLRPERLTVRRDALIELLKRAGVGCSVHWRPLHLHPYYQQTFGWRPEDFPVSTSVWERLISLPIFPGMQDEEIEHVVNTFRGVCKLYAR